MNPAPGCPCGAQRVNTSFGSVCSACLLQSGLESEQSAFGEYERLQLLGEGAMGAVYLARHRASEELVALKVARRELLERPGGFELFRRQGKTESALKHPNIVHVQGAGTCGGQPFLVMPLMQGGTLAEPERAAQYATPEARLQLVLKLARAVQFAHERGILHCDLKHDNILFDGEGEAHVSDFGLACTLDAAGAGDVEGVRGGTRGWMAPEQVTGDPLTTAADAFALGVLLHWLGTRQLPFGSDEEFERRVLCGPPPAAGDWSPELEWGLRAIAEKALQIRAEERYESPAALADDLVRLRDQRPLAGAKTPMLARAWLWTERHRGARNALFLLMPCFAALTFVLALAQRHELRAAVLSMNAYAASGQAATVLYQLREYANAIEHAAADPQVQALVRGAPAYTSDRRAPAGPHVACPEQATPGQGAALARHASRFSTMMVVDATGCVRFRVSDELTVAGQRAQRFVFEHYFRSARAQVAELEPATYVREAYRSSVSQRLRFAMATPLMDGDNWSGAVTGSITVASTLALPSVPRGTGSDQLTVLLGPFEGEPPATESGPPAEFTFLAHPALHRGRKVTLDAPLARELGAAFRGVVSSRQFELGSAAPLQRSDYVDPLLGDAWLAAFAPVGGTGYFVLVQTREATAIRPSRGLMNLGIALSSAAGAFMLACAYFSGWRWRRARSKQAPSTELPAAGDLRA